MKPKPFDPLNVFQFKKKRKKEARKKQKQER